MQSHANEHGDGQSAPRRPALSVPLQEDDIAAALHDPSGDNLRRENQRLAKAGRQRGILEGLFSEDPRRQFAALRQLAASPAITGTQYERICEIRRETPHLVVAEQAEKLLHEKPRDVQEAISEDTRREVAALIRAQEERQQRRLASAARVSTAASFSFSGVSLACWLACALAAGCLLGGLTTYRFLPRSQVTFEKSSEVYIDPRSGNLFCADAGNGEEPSTSSPEAGYEPAFYCWKCRQWLPVRKPRKAGESIEGPRQSLVERPLVPKDDRSRNKR